MKRIRNTVPPIRCCVISLFLLLSASSIATAQPEATHKEGLVEVRLKADKRTIMLGEPLYLAFEVTNLSSGKLCLAVGGDYRNMFGRPERFKVLVKTAEGTNLPKLESGAGQGDFYGCDSIEPGGTYTFRLLLSHWVKIERTGSYRVFVTRQMSFSNSSSSDWRDTSSDWRTLKYSMLAEAGAEFTVVPADENKMGGIINALGSVMLDASDPKAVDSATALASIEDKRVISYFAEALGRFGNFGFSVGHDTEFMISSRSITALATYDDDQAIAALQAAMKSTSDDVRLLVAKALGASPHRSASTLLMKMQDDSYYFVRLRVAQGLKNVETTEAKATLQKLLKDESNDVREAARESLN